ncbi:MAG: alpha/beta hydrolase family protein [Cellulomonas sp.]
MRYRIVTSSVVGVLVLAVLGAFMGPQWDPVPLNDPLVVASSSTAVTGAPPAQTYQVRQSVVTVQLDGTTVQARITEPIGASGPLPAVVFVHGAGTGEYSRAFKAQASSLAASGVVTMVPNKRLDTYSARHRDYVQMAADYAASVQTLRHWPGVDPTRVGVYAESEGAWIAPVMAADDPGLAFVVLTSAPVVPPRQQAAFAMDSYLRNTHVPNGVFRAIPRAVGMSLPGGGFEYLDFDVAPYQRRMHQPVFVAYGTHDASMPMVQGAEQVIRDLAIAGNGQYQVRYYAGADHGLKVDGAVAPDLLRDLSGWIRGLPATAQSAPQIAGATPHQTYWAAPSPMPRWLADGDAVLAVVIGAAGLLVLGPLAGLGVAGWRRMRGLPVRHRLGAGVAGRLVWIGGLAMATVGGLVWYLVAVVRLALDYERNSVIVQGGWVGVRLLGIAAVVACASLVDVARRPHPDGPGIATGAWGHVVVWSVLAGAVVLLVVTAYWGVFQLGI